MSLLRKLSAVAVLGVVMAGVGSSAGADPRALIARNFVPHRAVYDLRLGDASQESGIVSLRGRMVFEFTGAPCEGYVVNFRFVTEISDTEGNVQISDLRSASFEDGVAKRFLFDTQTFIGDKIREETKGRAERDDGVMRIRLKKPEKKELSFSDKVYFPTEHLIEIIAAAREGRTFLGADIYDGSENGDKVYPTATIIGRSGNDRTDKVAAKDSEIAILPDEMRTQSRWPVVISYFEPTGDGEQTPIYELHFLLYENGVSRRVEMGYGDFSIEGKLTRLEILDRPECEDSD